MGGLKLEVQRPSLKLVIEMITNPGAVVARATAGGPASVPHSPPPGSSPSASKPPDIPAAASKAATGKAGAKKGSSKQACKTKTAMGTIPDLFLGSGTSSSSANINILHPKASGPLGAPAGSSSREDSSGKQQSVRQPEAAVGAPAGKILPGAAAGPHDSPVVRGSSAGGGSAAQSFAGGGGLRTRVRPSSDDGDGSARAVPVVGAPTNNLLKSSGGGAVENGAPTNKSLNKNAPRRSPSSEESRRAAARPNEGARRTAFEDRTQRTPRRATGRGKRADGKNGGASTSIAGHKGERPSSSTAAKSGPTSGRTGAASSGAPRSAAQPVAVGAQANEGSKSSGGGSGVAAGRDRPPVSSSSTSGKGSRSAGGTKSGAGGKRGKGGAVELLGRSGRNGEAAERPSSSTAAASSAIGRNAASSSSGAISRSAAQSFVGGGGPSRTVVGARANTGSKSSDGGFSAKNASPARQKSRTPRREGNARTSHDTDEGIMSSSLSSRDASRPLEESEIGASAKSSPVLGFGFGRTAHLFGSSVLSESDHAASLQGASSSSASIVGVGGGTGVGAPSSSAERLITGTMEEPLFEHIVPDQKTLFAMLDSDDADQQALARNLVPSSFEDEDGLPQQPPQHGLEEDEDDINMPFYEGGLRGGGLPPDPGAATKRDVAANVRSNAGGGAAGASRAGSSTARSSPYAGPTIADEPPPYRAADAAPPPQDRPRPDIFAGTSSSGTSSITPSSSPVSRPAASPFSRPSQNTEADRTTGRGALSSEPSGGSWTLAPLKSFPGGPPQISGRDPPKPSPKSAAGRAAAAAAATRNARAAAAAAAATRNARAAAAAAAATRNARAAAAAATRNAMLSPSAPDAVRAKALEEQGR